MKPILCALLCLVFAAGLPAAEKKASDPYVDFMAGCEKIARAVRYSDAEKARCYAELCKVTGINYTKATKKLGRLRNNPEEWVDFLRRLKSRLRELR